MAGWNPDTTYWLNDVTTGIAEVVDWIFADDTVEWFRQRPVNRQTDTDHRTIDSTLRSPHHHR